MNILDIICGKTLIITSNDYKKKILSLMNDTNKLYNVKFMSLNEYQKNYYFDYDEKTIYYLMKKENIKVSNAITLIKNLYYIENKEYKSGKLNYLVKIKNDLDSNNLLIYNPYFKKYLEGVKIIVYGYDNLDKFSINMLKDAKFINEEIKDNNVIIYEFENILEEVEFVFNRISDLLISGVDINRIKLVNVTSEYISYLKRFSEYYNLEIDLAPSNIYGTMAINEFLELIKNDVSKEQIKDIMSKYSDTDLYQIIINILNRYAFFDHLSCAYELILYEIKNTTFKRKNYTNVIKIVDLFDYISDLDYVFLLGFNNGNIPVLYKDERYITDNIIEEVIASDTYDLNRISKLNTINALKRINNLVITYKLKTPFNTYFPSNLIDESNVKVERIKENSYEYSKFYNKLKYATYLDEYIKYGEYHNDLGLLYYNYKDMKYLTYDNAYSKIDSNSLLNYLENKLMISYSSIDNYYKCGFRYYLTNILKLDIYEEKFDTIIGNIFHYILSRAFNSNFDFSKEFSFITKDYQFNHKEKFFLDKLKNDLLFIIETINEYRLNTGLTNELYEQKVTIPLSNTEEVFFKGFVDKIMYKEKDGVTYLSIIDYKTGNPKINLDYLKYGLSMQLASYLYLISRSKLFPNIKYCGFYLQHILDNEIKIDSKKTYLEHKKDNLKLQGYTTNDLIRLSMFDASYEDSMMIKGIKTKNDGDFVSSAKVLNDLEIEEIINLCEEKIISAKKKILESEFTINPKVIKDDHVGCKFCKFRDICYHKEKDNVYLEYEEVE